MDVPNDKLREYSRRLLLARMELLLKNGFYGLLLMHIGFALTDAVENACTSRDANGEKICFNPDFLEKISDKELLYAMEHEVLHLALRHGARGAAYKPERFNIACDIVVNSNILKSNGMDERSIMLRANGGVQRHRAPDGREGYEFTAEELYALIPDPNGDPIKGPGSKAKGNGSKKKKTDNKEETQNDDSSPDKAQNEPEADAENEDSAGGGKETEKGGDGAQNGGARNSGGSAGKSSGREKGRAKNKKDPVGGGGWDEHTPMNAETEEDDTLRAVWVQRIVNAAEAIEFREASNGRGTLPAFAARLLKELRRPQTDWRTILNDFVQEEFADYSFSPPDRRFEESPFFLPDFNEKEDTVKDILFMVDTSGSMSDAAITAAFSEIKGAIDQFGGKLRGWLGFFDAAIIEPQPFENEDEFRVIRAYGGGGTDFQIIFEYVARHMQDQLPASIIILTDGYAPFPQEHLAMGIPVVWLLNNEEVDPPWGKVARIKIDDS